MKVSNRDKKLLLILAGIVVFLLFYVLGYNRISAAADELESAQSALRSEISDLKSKYDSLDSYAESMELCKEDIDKTLEDLPSRIYEEDFLSYLLTMETREGIKLTAVSLNLPELVSEFDNLPAEETLQQDPNAAPDDGMIHIYRTTASFNADLNYPQLKKILDYIYESKDKTSLESLSVSYNSETGKLAGVFEVSKYYATRRGVVYTPETLPRVSFGVKDLFGTT